MGSVLLLVAAGLFSPGPDEIHRLVGQLGSDSVVEREDATAQLRALGDEAVPALDRAALSSDPEIAGRARELVAVLAPHRADVAREMSHLLGHACASFGRGRLEACAAYAETLLKIDPEYAPALRLSEAARADESGRRRLLPIVEKWEAWTWKTPPPPPGPGAIHYPSRAAWPAILEAVRKEPIALALPAGEACAERILETMKIDIAFEDAKLEDILGFIRDASGLNLIVDARVRDRIDPDRKVTFKVKDLVIRNVLKLLLLPVDLEYRVTEEEVVLITDRMCARILR